MEFKEDNNESLDSFRVSLMGDKKFIESLEENKKLELIARKNKENKKRRKIIKNIKFNDIPNDIKNEFIEAVKDVRELDDETMYLYPIDFSMIKRVSRMDYQRTTGGKEIRRRLDKIAGFVALYEYIGPTVLIRDFLRILEKKINEWNKSNEHILSNIQDFKIIPCSEFKYSSDLTEQNYFIAHLKFQASFANANPNDYREYLLGIPRDEKREKPADPNELSGFVKEVTDRFVEKMESSRELDREVKYAFPVDFSIMKKPIELYKDDDGYTRYSDKAIGVNLIYKYRGPDSLPNEFKEVFQITIEKLILERKIFQKLREPLLMVGASLKKYKL